MRPSEKALKEFLRAKQINGWKLGERRAAQAGFEYVLDMCHTATGYDIKGMHGSNGESEAYDMAASTVEERPWKGKKDQERVADYIYDGMTAALKFVREQMLIKSTLEIIANDQ